MNKLTPDEILYIQRILGGYIKCTEVLFHDRLVFGNGEDAASFKHEHQYCQNIINKLS